MKRINCDSRKVSFGMTREARVASTQETILLFHFNHPFIAREISIVKELLEEIKESKKEVGKNFSHLFTILK